MASMVYWHPVSERPPFNKTVLIRCQDGTIMQGRLKGGVAHAHWVGACRWSWDMRVEKDWDMTVTHWANIDEVFVCA